MTDLAPLLTLADCARRLQCSERTIRREIAAGTLAAVRVRGLLRVTQDALAAYIASLTIEPSCPSDACQAADIRSESLSLLASVSSAHYRPALPAPTRGRSKMRSAAERSTLRQVARQLD